MPWGHVYDFQIWRQFDAILTQRERPPNLKIVNLTPQSPKRVSILNR